MFLFVLTIGSILFWAGIVRPWWANRRSEDAMLGDTTFAYRPEDFSKEADFKPARRSAPRAGNLAQFDRPIVLVTGAVLLLIGASIAGMTVKATATELDNPVSASARIIAFERSGTSKHPKCLMTLRYTVEGRVQEVTGSGAGKAECAHAQGDIVEINYEKANPMKYEFAANSMLIWLTGLGFAAGFAAAGAFISGGYIKATRGRRKSI